MPLDKAWSDAKGIYYIKVVGFTPSSFMLDSFMPMDVVWSEAKDLAG